MHCPSCKSEATTLLRSALSLQGVSFLKSVQGYFKCQHCGLLLRVTRYGKHFWLFFVPTSIVLTLFALLCQFLIPDFGNQTGVTWVMFILLISVTFALGTWKYAEAEIVNTEGKSGTDSST